MSQYGFSITAWVAAVVGKRKVTVAAAGPRCPRPDAIERMPFAIASRNGVPRQWAVKDLATIFPT